MKRKYLSDLVEWLNDDSRKPLIVWGARQVGKTYLIKSLFAEEYFKNNYIYVDCSNDSKFSNFVLENNNVDDIIDYLSLKYKKSINEKTLLIFDEAQECVPLISSLKAFYELHPEIPIILTGSMVRIKIKRTVTGAHKKEFLFPIGKINELYVYQLNFSEYLMNRNEVAYNMVNQAFSNFKPLSNELHHLVLDIFNEYLILGGMPEVVNKYLETEDYVKSLKILKELYNNYLADMDLYQASPEATIRSKSIFKNIFNLLSRESKNFSSSLIEKSTRTRDYVAPLDWLEMSFIVNKCNLVKEKVTTPLTNDDESIFRLYLADMGMFTYQSNLALESFLDKDSLNSLSGIYYENYVAIELVNAGYELFYWKGKNNAEFEFLIENNNEVIPLDVKKSKGKLNSLDKYKSHNKLSFAVKISANNLGYDKENKVLTIPYYATNLFLKSVKSGKVKEMINSLS